MADNIVTRRRFLNGISLALSGVAAAVVSVPIVAYLLSPLLHPAAQDWRDLGPVQNFQIGQTVEVAIDVWLRRNADQDFIAFGLNCTHLGCPVNWRADAELFLCPCHGGVYYSDGSVAGGPPPRPLVRYAVRIGQNNQVQVLTRPLTQTISQA